MERGLTTILAFFVILMLIVVVGKYETMKMDREQAGGASEERQAIRKELDFLDYEEDLPVEIKKLQARFNIVNNLAVAQIDEMDVEKLRLMNVGLITNLGTIILEFFPDVAPNHARNFLKLANEGYYDRTVFHRIAPDFIIQGGRGERKVGTVKAEFSDRKHDRGTLSMAHTGESVDSASSEFFICLGSEPSLDRDGNNPQTLFGQVVFGLDVVDKIANVPVGSNDRPKELVVVWAAVVLTSKMESSDL